ncbi:unnamed protein product [Camellia sinensis]
MVTTHGKSVSSLQTTTPGLESSCTGNTPACPWLMHLSRAIVEACKITAVASRHAAYFHGEEPHGAVSQYQDVLNYSDKATLATHASLKGRHV